MVENSLQSRDIQGLPTARSESVAAASSVDFSRLMAPRRSWLLEHGCDQKQVSLSTSPANVQFTLSTTLLIHTGSEVLREELQQTIQNMAIQFTGARGETFARLFVPDVPPQAIEHTFLFLQRLNALDRPQSEEAQKTLSEIVNNYLKELTARHLPFECDLGNTPSGIARRLTRMQRVSQFEQLYLATGTIPEGCSRELDLVRAQAKENLQSVLTKPKANLEAVEAVCLAKELSQNGKRIEALDIPKVRGLHTLHLPGELPYRIYALQLYIRAVEEKLGIDTSTTEGFKGFLPFLAKECMQSIPVTPSGGTIDILAELSYGHRPLLALLDLFTFDPRYEQFKKVGIHGPDLPKAPQGTWRNEQGEPTQTSRNIILRAMRIIAGREVTDDSAWSATELSETLPKLTVQTLRETPTNFWGTTARGALHEGYGDSPVKAVLDVIQSEKEFRLIRSIGITELDLPAVEKGLWSKNGVPTDTARLGIHRILEELGKRFGEGRVLNPKNPDDLLRILPHFKLSNFSVPVGPWKRDLSNLMATVYKKSPERALRDLAKNDPGYHFLTDLLDERYGT